MDVPASLIRAARYALNLSQEDLAEVSGVSARTILKVERNEPVKVETTRKLQAAMERFGVEFLDPDETGRPGLRVPIIKGR